MSTWNEKGKLVLKLDMLYFKGIIMTDTLCSFCMYLVCYKLSISLAYPDFSCYMNSNDCTMYTSRQIQDLEHFKDDMPLNWFSILSYICFDVTKDFMTLRWFFLFVMWIVVHKFDVFEHFK